MTEQLEDREGDPDGCANYRKNRTYPQHHDMYREMLEMGQGLTLVWDGGSGFGRIRLQ